jgi:CRP-like cAMP-binding protein
MEDLLTKQSFKKGETIIQEGTESYNVYIIMAGEAEVTKSCFGKEVSVRILKKDDVFGALSLIAKSPRSATVIARTDIEVGMIYKEDFISVLEKLPPEVNQIMKEMMDELRASYELSAELAILTREMLDIKERMKSLNREKLKEYLSQTPELVQTMFLSLDSSLMNMIHNFYTLAQQLDKTIVDVDALFKESFGQSFKA